MESNRIHIVCSSGGVKCFSYIGVFQKLIEYNIPIASVSACSMGTILGALLCSGLDAKKLEEVALNFDFSVLKKKKSFYFLKRFFYPYATHHTPDYPKIMEKLIGKDVMLKEMVVPFSAAALDVRQKRFLVYSSSTHPDMKISDVARIATAIPFLYDPYKLDKHLLVDAAVASESPVWMATANPDLYSIVILKINSSPNEKFKKNIFSYLANLFNVSSGSHDYFAISQSPRSIEININCEEMAYNNFNITKEQIENLILQGQIATEQKLKEFNYNFNNRLNVEEIKGIIPEDKDATRAMKLADQMILNYQNENLNRNQVFISYSRKDKEWLTKFQSHLRTIERFSGVKIWDDTSIKAGSDWNKEIERALISTKVAVFLVTSNFLASEFIQDKEMKYFLEISKREKVPILWIAVSACNFEITPLNHIQCANNPQKTLDQLSEAEQNIEFTRICKLIIEKMDTDYTNRY